MSKKYNFVKTDLDAEREQWRKDYACNGFMRPYSRTIVLNSTGEQIGRLDGSIIIGDRIRRSNRETVFIHFDSIDQATYDFWFCEFNGKEAKARNCFQSPSPLKLKLEYKSELEAIFKAFRRHMLEELGHSIDVFYLPNYYGTTEPDEDGFCIIDNDDYLGFKLAMPEDDTDPGFYSVRRFRTLLTKE